MEQYISKSALVAEIEKLQLCTMDEHMNFYSAEAQGEYNALSKLESFLDILEVKDVDLGKEVDIWYDKFATNNGFDWNGFAQHFFELGIKARKEE